MIPTHGMYDNTFKLIITSGWNIKSDGDVEAPCGFFTLVEIPEHKGENDAMREAVTDFEVLDYKWPEPGWYTTAENSQGFIFVFKHASQYAAQLAYNSSEASYLRWYGEAAEQSTPDEV